MLLFSVCVCVCVCDAYRESLNNASFTLILDHNVLIVFRNNVFEK